jgi:signal transduction histidine kinase
VGFSTACGSIRIRRDGSCTVEESAPLAATPLTAFSQQRGQGTATLTGPDGEPGVGAVADQAALGDAGLSLVAGAPRRALLDPANRRFEQDLFLLAGVAAATFLAVWLTAEFALRRQIARITRMATGLAGGDLAARIAAPLPRGELGALMQVLNRTAESLQGQRADIEQLNERLRQAQRLEAVGQLTGGVAHDFNNLLTVVLGNAEVLAEEQTLEPEQRALAEQITQAARRGAELTHRLLAFARRQPLQPKVVEVNALVRSLEPMLRRTLGEHIEIELRCEGALWPALVDQGQLENALLNLSLNARDAMPGGGKLTFETPSPGPLHLRVHRRRHGPPRRAGPRRAAAEQALPPRRPGPRGPGGVGMKGLRGKPGTARPRTTPVAIPVSPCYTARPLFGTDG